MGSFMQTKKLRVFEITKVNNSLILVVLKKLKSMVLPKFK
jgi:hypothetical protein